MNISIKVIPHSKQRYPTPGDWIVSKRGDVKILISRLGNWQYEMLIGFHELCEVLICKYMGISQAEVDAFDIKFEKDRRRGKHSSLDEPGDSPDAPYREAHRVATVCEKTLSFALGVDWSDYERACLDLELG